ncbi:hypothetical protein [Chthonobacter rhizosphaerae]|uniref:hypothetical protein n=1 Tax=Chthonobacter rhizosphaerae TaxID=2735553 RepID=UPI0015EE4AC7|nr:hypothetical protein [Chthonobacter rhizosphaerae]
MITRSFLLVAFITGAASGTAYSDELLPLHGKSIDLGSVMGSAYYTPEANGYQIVTTLSSEDSTLPVRFTSTLTSGQNLTVTVPGALGEPERTIKFERIGEQLFVTEDGRKTAAFAE